MGRDPEESDLDEVVVSESDTESDEEDKSDDPRSSKKNSENNVPNAPITDNSTETLPLESASQEIELLPLLSDPEASVPENELIERYFHAMEAELTERTDKNHRQVASFALI